MRKIQITRYNCSWPKTYKKEEKKLRAILQKEISFIAHIGSTAIPSLKAKPIVDILIGVKNIKEVNSYNQLLIKAGYVPKGAFGVKNRRFFIKYNKSKRLVHLHVFKNNNPETIRHLLFKEFLIYHSNEKKEYENLKVRLAKRYPFNIDAYVEGKKKLIKTIDQKASAWASRMLLAKKYSFFSGAIGFRLGLLRNKQPS